MNILKSTRTDPSCTDGNVVRKVKDFPVGTEVYIELNEEEEHCKVLAIENHAVVCKTIKDNIIFLVEPDSLAEVDMGG